MNHIYPQLQGFHHLWSVPIEINLKRELQRVTYKLPACASSVGTVLRFASF